MPRPWTAGHTVEGQPQVAAAQAPSTVLQTGAFGGFGSPVSVTASRPQQGCPPRETFEWLQSNHERGAFGLWCADVTVSESCSRDETSRRWPRGRAGDCQIFLPSQSA